MLFISFSQASKRLPKVLLASAKAFVPAEEKIAVPQRHLKASGATEPLRFSRSRQRSKRS